MRTYVVIAVFKRSLISNDSNVIWGLLKAENALYIPHSNPPFLASMSTAIDQFILPDTLRQWPWPRQLNPAYLACKKETTSWTESLQILSPEKQRKFNRCDFSMTLVVFEPGHVF
jgi:hypothetical protein